MNGLGILAIGMLTVCAAAPDLPLLLLDLTSFHVEGRQTIAVAACARERAVARCVVGGWCDE